VSGKICRRSIFLPTFRTADEPGLLLEGSFKAAEIRYTDVKEINQEEVNRYLRKAVDIQWDYKNIMKNRWLLRLE
jgi:hypothetical protein